MSQKKFENKIKEHLTGQYVVKSNTMGVWRRSPQPLRFCVFSEKWSLATPPLCFAEISDKGGGGAKRDSG